MQKINIMTLRLLGLMIGICLLTGSSMAQSTQDSSNTIVFTDLDDSEVGQDSNPVITLELDQVPLKEALKQIAGQAEAGLYYNTAFLPKKTVTLHLQAVPLDKALRKVLAGTSLRVITSGRNITLRAKEEAHPMQRPVASTQENITGTVTDAQSGETLPGVNILVKGTTTGASTDQKGQYELTTPSLQDTLIFTYIGYQRQEVPINGRTEINLAMQPQAITGEEMVVVGYGTQQKENITGSQSSVNFNDQELESQPVTDAGQALNGKIAGVQVIQSSGQPGSSSTIQIRGTNSISANTSPLIVLNGNPLPGYNLNMINPTDIESIEVLKDAASTAIYGSRAANGVVLITTKSGIPGKTQVSLNYSAGIQQVIGKRDVMNGPEYAQAAIDAAQNGWIDQGGDPDAPNTIAARGNSIYTWPEALENPENLPNTDWQDEIYRSVPIQKTNLRVSGGSEGGTTYTLSGGYMNQKGIVIQSNFKKYSLNTRINNKVNNWLKVGGMANLVYGDQRFAYGRINEWAQQYPSIYPVYDEETGHLGSPTTEGFEEWSGGLLFRPNNGHPLYRQYDDLTQNRVNGLGNLFADFSILQGLDFKTTLNYYYNTTKFNNYQAIEHDLGPSAYTQGVKSVNQNRTNSYNWQNQLTYNNDFNAHHLNATLGFEYNKDNHYSTFAQRTGYDNDLVPYLPGGEDITGASEGARERVLISTFGRINYNFKERYLASASLRYDGSSRFGPNNKWGEFPAFSVGWRVSNEPFMKQVSAVSNLKIRASYGLTGNDNFGDYAWISALNKQRVAFGDNLTTTYEPSGFTNRNLEWEKNKELNVGLNMGLFNSRIIFVGDYYHSVSDNLLLNVPIPAITGFTNNFQNAGELINRGFELDLTTRNLTGQFSWTTNLNFSHNQSEVTALGRDNASQLFEINAGLSQINKVGEPPYSFYTYVFDGIYKSQAEIDADPASYPGAAPGNQKIADINGDGEITAGDRKIVGGYEPDFTWGVTNTFNYKGFDLSFLFQGADGGLIFDHNVPRGYRWHEGRNYISGMVNRWRSPENPGDGKHPKLTTELGERAHLGNSNWLFPASYIRLKNLTFGHTFNQTLLSKLGMSQLRVFFTGRNLFTITDSPIPDPVSNNGGAGTTPGNVTLNRSNDGGGARFRGITGYAYPSAKVYSMGINVSF